MKSMKQQCYLFNVWATWLGIPALAVFMGVLTGWWAAPVVILAGVVAQVYYIRLFPKMSQAMGYGSVDDAAPSSAPARTPAKVTLYTASVCPFCPIVRRRLVELQRTMGFELTEIDITFQPGVAREKGLRSVPAIETAGRLHVGNATSAELVSFLTRQ